MWDVVCLGELFIDLVPHTQVDGQWLLMPSPGGAPGNVAAGLARLGHRALMVSRVGDDGFGRLLTAALRGHGVDVSGVVVSTEEQAGISVVSLDAAGDRSFTFYHDRPADQAMRADDIAPDWLARSQFLHVGILPLASPVSAAAQRRAMDEADAHGVRISCDVNLRPALWRDAADMLSAAREVIARSAIVKLSEEELRSLAGHASEKACVRSLWHDGIELFSVTRGARGATLHTRQGVFEGRAVTVDAVDTTGAGDAYAAAVLSGLIRGMDPQALLDRACTAGALAASRKGAMQSLPAAAELAAFRPVTSG